jgi:hypothetical protein
MVGSGGVAGTPAGDTPASKGATMGGDASLHAENTRQRERLRALVGRLSDADLERPLGHGWTVAAALVHLAFWDLRAVTLMDRFEREGVKPSAADVDVVNDTVHALGRAIAPRAAARLCLEAAEAADRRVERVSDATLAAVAAAGAPFRPDRHVHRAEHLDEIERALR